MRAVPEPVKAIGALTAFGHKTGSTGQDVLVALGNNLDNGRTVEADNISVARKPPRKGFFMIRTGTTQSAERHVAWHQRKLSEVLRDKVSRKLTVCFLPVYPS
jgi:hypothetical protein